MKNLFFLPSIMALILVMMTGHALANSVSPTYKQALDEAARVLQRDRDNKILKASLNMPAEQDQRWENSVVASVIAQYWSVNPGKKNLLIAEAQSRFPWYEHKEASALNEIAPYANSTNIPLLHPSSQYIQPSLGAYDTPPSALRKSKSTDSAKYPILINDPFEGLNRGIFYFNAKFDQYFFIPITDSYKFLTPDIVEAGIHNFFENITEITSFGNEILQLHLLDASKTALRFGINSTIGLAGFIDVAKVMGLPQDKEDFGQTLGRWGVGDGPYMVLPIFGPSNLRDTTGLVVDTVAFSLIDPLEIATFREDYPVVYAVQAVDTRASIDYRYHKSGSPFEYDLVRYLIAKKRQLDILK